MRWTEDLADSDESQMTDFIWWSFSSAASPTGLCSLLPYLSLPLLSLLSSFCFLSLAPLSPIPSLPSPRADHTHSSSSMPAPARSPIPSSSNPLHSMHHHHNHHNTHHHHHSQDDYYDDDGPVLAGPAKGDVLKGLLDVWWSDDEVSLSSAPSLIASSLPPAQARPASVGERETLTKCSGAGCRGTWGLEGTLFFFGELSDSPALAPDLPRAGSLNVLSAAAACVHVPCCLSSSLRPSEGSFLSCASCLWSSADFPLCLLFDRLPPSFLLSRFSILPPPVSPLCWLPHSQEEDPECPLCMEEMDLSDVNFKPCPCGYQVRLSSFACLRWQATSCCFDARPESQAGRVRTLDSTLTLRLSCFPCFASLASVIAVLVVLLPYPCSFHPLDLSVLPPSHHCEPQQAMPCLSQRVHRGGRRVCARRARRVRRLAPGLCCSRCDKS